MSGVTGLVAVTTVYSGKQLCFIHFKIKHQFDQSFKNVLTKINYLFQKNYLPKFMGGTRCGGKPVLVSDLLASLVSLLLLLPFLLLYEFVSFLLLVRLLFLSHEAG